MRAQPTASHYVNGRYIEDEGGAPLPVIYPATGEKINGLAANAAITAAPGKCVMLFGDGNQWGANISA